MNITQTVWTSYQTPFVNLGTFAPVAAFWSIASVGAKATALVLTEDIVPDAGANTILVVLAPYLLALIISVAGSVCLSIVWHRFLILGEAPNRLFPANRDVIGPDFVRCTAAMALPIAVILLGAWAYRESSDSIVLAALSYFAAPVTLARLGRLLLILPASATGDRETTVRESLRATKGRTTSLFLALLACSLPWSVVRFGLDQWAQTFEENSLEELSLLAVESVADFARNVTWTAFMSFAYLEFVRPPEAQARHFS